MIGTKRFLVTVAQYVGDRGDNAPSFQSPLNSSSQPQGDEPPTIDPFIQPTAPAPVVQPPQPAYSQPAATLAEIDQQNRAPHEEARAAVDAAFGAVPYTPPVFPDFSASTTSQPAESAPQNVTQVPGAFPPLPDFSTLPPLPPAPVIGGSAGALPPEKLEDMLAPVTPIAAPAPQSTDPGQFRIPGQP